MLMKLTTAVILLRWWSFTYIIQFHHEKYALLLQYTQLEVMPNFFALHYMPGRGNIRLAKAPFLALKKHI